MSSLDDWQLGFRSRGSRHLSLGTQHRFFQNGVKRARILFPHNDSQEEDQQQTEEGTGQKTNNENEPDNGQTKDPPREQSQGQDHQGHGSGGEAPTPPGKGPDSKPETGGTSSSPPVERQPSAPKQADQQGSQASEVRGQDGTQGTSSGFRGTDQEGGATGGDGLSSTTGEHSEQSSTGRVRGDQQEQVPDAKHGTTTGGEA